MKTYKWKKKEIDFFNKTIKEAKTRLNLESWMVSSSYISGGEYTEDIDGINSDVRQFTIDAENIVTQEYEKIEIRWHPSALRILREKGEDVARVTIYHEMIHCITQELFNKALKRHVARDEVIDAVERLTQRIAMIVLN